MPNFLTDIQVKQLIGDLRQEQRGVNDVQTDQFVILQRRVLELEKEINPDRQPDVQPKPKIELKPCPFCGESESLTMKPGEKGTSYVHCDNCWAQGPPRSDEQAMRRWSQRVT